MPALPLDDAGPYVAGAYLVFLGLLLVYLVIMAVRQARIQKDVDEIARIIEAREAAERPQPRDEVTDGAPRPDPLTDPGGVRAL